MYLELKSVGIIYYTVNDYKYDKYFLFLYFETRSEFVFEKSSQTTF